MKKLSLRKNFMKIPARKTYFEKLKKNVQRLCCDCPKSERLFRNCICLYTTASSLLPVFQKDTDQISCLERLAEHMYRQMSLDCLLLIRRERPGIPIDITVVTQYEEILRDINDENRTFWSTRIPRGNFFFSQGRRRLSSKMRENKSLGFPYMFSQQISRIFGKNPSRFHFSL